MDSRKIVLKKKKILFNGTGNQNWIGGLYYLKNIIFSCLQNDAIMQQYDILVWIDLEHADIFQCFKHKITIKIIKNTGKWHMAFIMLRAFMFENVRWSYAHALTRTGKLFKEYGVLWIPDFQHRKLPEFFPLEEIQKRDKDIQYAIACKNPMVLSSFDSQQDLKQFYKGIMCEEHVVHFVSYIEEEIENISEEFEREILKKYDLFQYIYIPNQFWKHKNHIIVVKAIEKIIEKNVLAEYFFVFTGQLEDYRNPTYISQIKSILQKTGIRDRIRLLGFVERKEQIAIMKNAAFIIQPSLCEGWGTVLEDAKVLDKTVLLSDLPVHREQMYDKCILFNPYDEDELVSFMELTVSSKKEENISRGIGRMYEQAGEYSKELERILCT